MKLESVRLLHALGVPDHYIANQVYQPIDEDHRQRGSFIILFDQSHTNDGAFVASLINTLIREYYRQQHDDRLNCFEQTLVRMNQHIKEYAESRDDHEPLFLNGTIVLFLNDEIHITYVGAPMAYLRRQDSLIELVESKPTAKSNTVPSFSLITSGEVVENDILVLISSLEDASHLEKDISFALTHSPLLEATRAYARLLKEQYEQATEATFIRFSTDSEETFQVYVDKSLESTGDRVSEWQKSLVRHATSLPKVFKRRSDIALTKDESAVVDETTDALIAQADASSTVDDEPVVDAQVDASEETPEFVVKTYRQTEDAHATHAAAPTILESEIPHQDRVGRNSFGFRIPKLRTLYMLIGAIAFLVILIRIMNFLPIGSPTTAKDPAARDALIAQADAAMREVDTAQVQNNTTEAISGLLTVLNFINQIDENEHTEQSKQLRSSATEKLATLTRTIQLGETTLSQSISDEAIRVVSTPSGSFVFLRGGAIQKFTETDITTISGVPPESEIVDAVAFDSYKLIAFATKDPVDNQKVYSLDASTGSITELKRSDNKAWPPTRLLASYVANLYFIGDSLWKATGQQATWQVIAYARNAPTTTVSSIIVDDGFFYALEDGKQLVRIDNKGSKTTVAYFGVPEEFLPETNERLIASRKQGTVYLFDRDEKRLIELTTDGGYRRQYLLPQASDYIDCDSTDVGFVCATTNRTVEAFVLTQ